MKKRVENKKNIEEIPVKEENYYNDDKTLNIMIKKASHDKKGLREEVFDKTKPKMVVAKKIVKKIVEEFNEEPIVNEVEEVEEEKFEGNKKEKNNNEGDTEMEIMHVTTMGDFIEADEEVNKVVKKVVKDVVEVAEKKE